MLSNQLESFKAYYNAGFRQSENVIKCFAKSNKDRDIKIGKALTFINSLGLMLKIEKSQSDNSFFVKPLFN